jgi:hypothetical protein
MLDKLKNELLCPVSPPASPEGEADGGQAESRIQHHLVANKN